MSPLVDRVAVVVARHSPITGLGYSRTRCGCGEVFSRPYVKSHAAHVAEQIAAELQLTEEEQWIPVAESGDRWKPRSEGQAKQDRLKYPVGGKFSDDEPWDGIAHIEHERRWVSAWSAAEEKP